MNSKELENLVRGLVERQLAKETVDKGGTPGEVNSPGSSPTAKVVTEMDVREAGLGGTVLAAPDAIVTAAAEDLARSWGVNIRRGSPAAKRVRRVAVGADHAGFEMKGELAKFLATLEEVEVLDLGTHGNQIVDYPDFAHAVAEAVSTDRAELGIIVDGAGIGSAITANKVPGIRAAMCYDASTARNSREHNFANVLTLGARMIDAELMKEIVKTFLDTPAGEERHAARVRKIMEVEKRYRKG